MNELTEVTEVTIYKLLHTESTIEGKLLAQ